MVVVMGAAWRVVMLIDGIGVYDVYIYVINIICQNDDMNDICSDREMSVL